MTLLLSASDFFAAKLAYETDPADLAAARGSGSAPVVIDTRSAASWSQGRIPGAVHIPNAELETRIAGIVPDRSAEIVVYCWGPGCNAGVKAAACLSAHGRAVKEMLGGFEYFAREGHPVEGEDAHRYAREDSGLVGVFA
jgi:rhodanese-related sulfurtransferase